MRAMSEASRLEASISVAEWEEVYLERVSGVGEQTYGLVHAAAARADVLLGPREEICKLQAIHFQVIRRECRQRERNDESG